MKISRFGQACCAPLLGSLLLALLPGPGAHAQSFCASDGQPQPTQLLERFINADCASCWQDAASPPVTPGQLALDWVLPGSQGDDAPLSAVATRDAAQRRGALQLATPSKSDVRLSAVRSLPGASLRVAHGLPVSGYIGASISLTPAANAAPAHQWTAWLALVETLPKGTEGSPVARNLVRNTFKASWDGRKQLSKTERPRFIEQRSMGLPEGMDTRRLRVIGWIEDETGEVWAAAASHCLPARP
jgi:hypothetical protein